MSSLRPTAAKTERGAVSAARRSAIGAGLKLTIGSPSAHLYTVQLLPFGF
jgi:hypothetical protein